MDQDSEINELRAAHQKLETQIDEEMDHPAPDAILIQGLKRQKLRLKDEIAKLAAEHSS